MKAGLEWLAVEEVVQEFVLEPLVAEHPLVDKMAEVVFLLVALSLVQQVVELVALAGMGVAAFAALVAAVLEVEFAEECLVAVEVRLLVVGNMEYLVHLHMG